MNGFFIVYIVPVLIVAIGLAAPMAITLAFLDKKFKANANETAAKIRENLPNINCGGCGYAGCAAFAEALLKGEASVEKCRPSKKLNREIITQILRTDDA